MKRKDHSTVEPLGALIQAFLVMRSTDELDGDGAGLWLDPARRYRLVSDERGRPLRLLVDGVPHTDPPMVPASTRLRGIIGLHQSTGHPVLLSDGERFVGVCCEHDILRALCEGGGRPARDSAQNVPAMSLSG